jgi:hypothetical protein
MRAVFVNHCHPDTPHVCALRVTSFALAMSARGHQVVLLTETLDDNDDGQNVHELADDLAGHNWVVPFSLPVKPISNRALSRLRTGKTPNGWRQMMIAKHYLMNSGVFGDWRKAAAPHLKVLADDFQPEIIWASFGNTDVWNIASDLSKRAGCPWVGDLKDNWSAFLPRGFKQMIAHRFRHAVAMTAFSKAHQLEAGRWFKSKASVIYSGFDEEPVTADVPERRRILLTGSVYNDAQAAELIEGIKRWLSGRDAEADRVELCYAGADAARIRTLVAPLEDACNVVINDYLALDELRSMQAGAWVNAYMYSPRSLFQHKPLELLAAGRPVLAFPDESAEVLGIATEVDGTLKACVTANEVCNFLTVLENDAPTPPNQDRLNAYSWQGQAEILEKVLGDVVQRS